MRERSTHSGKIPKKDSQCICLSVTLINSVFRKGKNYHCQVFLEECKYITEEEEVTRHITEGLEISSDLDKSDEE